VGEKDITYLTGAEANGDLRPQYETSANVRSRFKVYEYARHPINIKSEVVRYLQLTGEECLLDVGCAEGSDLLRIRQLGHTGTLIGTDIASSADVEMGLLFHPSIKSDQSDGSPPIELISSAAPNLPFKDGSLDVILALFMIYHVPSPHAALQEFQRILKPGGKLVLATSGKFNKSRHRKLERLTADAIGVEPPPLFSAHFDTDDAAEILPKYFRVPEEEHFVQQDEMVITEGEPLTNYYMSLQSMGKNYDPLTQRRWRQGLNHWAMPLVRQEIERNGYFRDEIDRQFWVCYKAET
jgi:ubiquinone/menaquinone biosynthesis C-methylase UbiE